MVAWLWGEMWGEVREHVGKRAHFMTQGKGLEIASGDHSCGGRNTGLKCGFCVRHGEERRSCFFSNSIWLILQLSRIHAGFMLIKASQRSSLSFNFKRSGSEVSWMLLRCYYNDSLSSCVHSSLQISLCCETKTNVLLIAFFVCAEPKPELTGVLLYWLRGQG